MARRLYDEAVYAKYAEALPVDSIDDAEGRKVA